MFCRQIQEKSPVINLKKLTAMRNASPCQPATHRLLRLAFLIFSIGLLAAPAAHAGLTMEVDLNRGNYQGYQYYFFGCQLFTNNTPPNVSFGDYFVVSPGWPTNANASATLFHFDTNGLSQVSSTCSGGFSLFDAPDFSDSFIQNVTNGQWTIFVTNTDHHQYLSFFRHGQHRQQCHSFGVNYLSAQQRVEHHKPANLSLAKPDQLQRAGSLYAKLRPRFAGDATKLLRGHAGVRDSTASRWILTTSRPSAWSVRCQPTAPEVPFPVGFPPGMCGTMPTCNSPSAARRPISTPTSARPICLGPPWVMPPGFLKPPTPTTALRRPTKAAA